MTRNYPVPPAVTFDAVGSGGYLQLKQRTYLIRLKCKNYASYSFDISAAKTEKMSFRYIYKVIRV